MGEYYRVNIGSSRDALLWSQGFEGATKRNRPNLLPGDVVYARVTLANRDMSAELTCTAPASSINAKEWVTGEAIYGPLKNGFVFDCSISLASKLLDDNCVVLNHLGTRIPFEIAVGVNGKVWIHSGTHLHTILASNCILNSEHLSVQNTKLMVDKLFAYFSQ